MNGCAAGWGRVSRGGRGAVPCGWRVGRGALLAGSVDGVLLAGSVGLGLGRC